MKATIAGCLTIIALCCRAVGGQTNAPIPWDQIGSKAGADYNGDGLSVTATDSGARLHCAFQRMDGEATAEGLWLTSTVTNGAGDRFRVKAVVLRTSRCYVPARVPAGGTNSQASTPCGFVPPPDATLPPSLASYCGTNGAGDGSARQSLSHLGAP